MEKTKVAVARKLISNSKLSISNIWSREIGWRAYILFKIDDLGYVLLGSFAKL